MVWIFLDGKHLLLEHHEETQNRYHRRYHRSYPDQEGVDELSFCIVALKGFRVPLPGEGSNSTTGRLCWPRMAWQRRFVSQMLCSLPEHGALGRHIKPSSRMETEINNWELGVTVSRTLICFYFHSKRNDLLPIKLAYVYFTILSRSQSWVDLENPNWGVHAEYDPSHWTEAFREQDRPRADKGFRWDIRGLIVKDLDY